MMMLNTEKKNHVYRKNMVLIMILLLFMAVSINAADVTADMDTADGSTGFVFRDITPVIIGSIDSNGNFMIKGGMRIDSGGTENTAAETLVVDVSVSSPVFQGVAAVTFGNVGFGTTVTGSALSVVPTSWTATPTISGLITATSGLTANGALTANAVFTLGDNGETGAINTSDWDISATGAMSGISGIANNGAYTQSGATANTFTGILRTDGSLDCNGLFTLGDNGETGAIDTSDWDISTTGVLTGISGITTNGGYTQSGAGANTFSGTLDADGTFTLGDGGDLGSINTSDWDISTTGSMTGISGITTNGGYTQTGGSVNTFTGTYRTNGTLVANSNFTLGDNGDNGNILTSDWDISTTGVLTGISGITTNGGYTQSGATNNTFTANVGIGAAPVERLSVEGAVALREQGAAPGATANYGKIYARSSDGKPMYRDDAGNIHYFIPDYIKITHQTASGTAAGAIAVGWGNVRPLTTEEYDAGNHASLAANIITLQPGTYRYLISAPARYCDRHKIRLWDVDAGSTVNTGTNQFANNASSLGHTRSTMVGEITIGVATQFRIDHYASVARGTDGLGLAATSGLNEVYCVVELWKVRE